jgi:hypothetical protein
MPRGLLQDRCQSWPTADAGHGAGDAVALWSDVVLLIGTFMRAFLYS